jgi:hypothetical protein
VGGEAGGDGAAGRVVEDIRWAGPVAGVRPINVRKGGEGGRDGGGHTTRRRGRRWWGSRRRGGR